MTDKEIIKALECCQISGTCKECPLLYRRNADCVDCLASEVLNLINRQQNEIIKKFAEKLKENQYREAGIEEYADMVVTVNDIDNLVLEMTGE